MAGQREEADQMLRAARQDGETVQQQLHGEILELKLTCRRLEERLSASDREHLSTEGRRRKR